MALFGFGRKSRQPASPPPPAADPAPALETASQVALGALRRLDSNGTFLGLFDAASFPGLRVLADGSQQVELAGDGLRITLHERAFRLEALGIDATRMAVLVAGIAFKHAVGEEPRWLPVSRPGEPEILEGSVPLGPVSLIATIRAGEQAVAGRRAPGSELLIGLGTQPDTAPPRDDLSQAARDQIAAAEGVMLGTASVILGAVLLQMRLRPSRSMADLLDTQPIAPPLAPMGRNSLGQKVHADAARGIWTGVTDDRFELSCPSSGTAPAIAALQGVFQFFGGQVSAPQTEGEVTGFVLTSTEGQVFDLTFKAQATPFKDPGGRVVPGVTITFGRRPA